MTRWAIAAGDFTPLGGMDRANHALARYLAQQQREVHLIAHRVWPDLASMPNVSVHEAARPLGLHLLGAPLLSRQADAVARRLGPGTRLLSNGGNTRWRGAATWIHYLHAAYEPDAAGLRGQAGLAMSRRSVLAAERQAVSVAPAVICNSERTATQVRACYAVPVSRLHVVYYGTDAEFGPADPGARGDSRRALGLDPARRLAIFVGALGDRRKGFDLLFDAWVTLCRDASWDVDLAVAGTGAELAAWRRRAAEQGSAGRIRFLGFRDDIARVLAAADVIVHPSRYEAYGLGVHEALCRGLPAIVAAEAGVAERLPAALAPLVLRGGPSVEGLIDALRRWRADEAQWRTEAMRVGTDLRRRSWDHMAADVAAIVERI